MIQLNPKEKFIISRGLPDSSDTTTYYIRAYVRDAKTDTLIKTVDLVDKGNQRFQQEYEAPHDPSGNGVQIIISTIVYTDSGYTTKSPDYGMEYVEYLVQQRYNPVLPEMGFGGVDINYKKIDKIVSEKVNLATKDIIILFKEELKKLPKQKDINIKEIIMSFSNSVLEAINDIDSNLLSKIDNVSKKIDVKEKPDRTDEIKKLLEEVLGRVNYLENKIGEINVSPVVKIEKDEYPEKTFSLLRKIFKKKPKEVTIENKKLKSDFGLRSNKSNSSLINEFNL